MQLKSFFYGFLYVFETAINETKTNLPAFEVFFIDRICVLIYPTMLMNRRKRIINAETTIFL